MALLKKLKSLLGFDDSDAGSGRRGDVSVTVEHEPEERGSDEATTAESSGVSSAAESAAEPETPDVESRDERVVETDTDAQETVTEPDAQETVTEPDEVAADTDETVSESTADEATPELEPETAGTPVDDIKGIGPSYAERLDEQGIDDIAALAEADAETLAEETGISEKRLTRWIGRAKNR